MVDLLWAMVVGTAGAAVRQPTGDNGDWLPVAAFVLAAYGAVVSSVLAFRQIWYDRRRLRIVVGTVVSFDAVAALEVLSVCAINERQRPIQVQNAGVITENGAVYIPMLLTPRHMEPPGQPLLNDGENVTFHFDILSFEKDGYLPKRVWVEDFSGRRYNKRFGRRRRRELLKMIEVLRARLGPDVQSQHELVSDTYHQSP